MDWNVWGPPLAVLVVGLVVGGGLAFTGRGSRWRHDPRQADLAARKEVLLKQLRDLDGERDKLQEAEWAARREALLSEAAEVVRTLEEGPEGEPPRGPEADEGAGRHLLYYGIGTLVFFLVAGLVLSKTLAPRGDGSMTGNAQSVDGPLADAKAAWAADPTNLDACNTMVKAAIYTGDLMTAMNQQDQCAGLKRDDPVVVAHSAALYLAIGRYEEAQQLLAPHVGSKPPVWEAELWSGLAHLNMGEVDEGLAKLQSVADGGGPLDAEFARFVIADVKSNLAAGPTKTSSAAPEPSAGPAMVSGTISGSLEPGGTLFVYVKNAPQDGGPPLGARKVTNWSLPLDFSMGVSDLLPFAGGQWPEPAYVKVKLARSGDPKVPSDGDVESEWVGPVSADEPLSIVLGQ